MSASSAPIDNEGNEGRNSDRDLMQPPFEREGLILFYRLYLNGYAHSVADTAASTCETDYVPNPDDIEEPEEANFEANDEDEDPGLFCMGEPILRGEDGEPEPASSSRAYKSPQNKMR